MEARAQFRSTQISRWFIALFVVIAAIGLAAMGAYAASRLSAPGASVQTTVHPAAGTVLRQDNPVSTTVYPAAGTVLRQDNPVSSSASSLAASGQANCDLINYRKAC
jgi:hypothetical protein